MDFKTCSCSGTRSYVANLLYSLLIAKGNFTCLSNQITIVQMDHLLLLGFRLTEIYLIKIQLILRLENNLFCSMVCSPGLQGQKQYPPVLCRAAPLLKLPSQALPSGIETEASLLPGPVVAVTALQISKSPSGSFFSFLKDEGCQQPAFILSLSVSSVPT